MSHSVITWVDARIADVLRAPRMWGATAESVEMQLLQLLEVRDVAADARGERVDTAWNCFLRERFPHQRAAGSTLVNGDFDALAALMRDFTTSRVRFSADFLADLEGDAIVFAAAPRLIGIAPASTDATTTTKKPRE